MPIYEYRCPNGHTFEAFQKMSDAPAETCSICGAGPVEKLLFPVAVHFKGSGFYSTDYGKGSRKPPKESGEAAAGGKASTDKTDKGQREKGSGEAKKPTADGG